MSDKTTNATVDDRHKNEAAKAAGYLNFDDVDQLTPPTARVRRSILAHAQALANLEAARAENADLTNRLAEIARLLATYQAMFRAKRQLIEDAHALASGHTPSPCPSCAAKDEAMEAFKADLSDTLIEFYGGYENSRGEDLSRFIIPPADPLAEALKAALKAWYRMPVPDEGKSFAAALAELKSRLGGA